MCGPKCNYDEKRLIDATHLEKEMREYAQYIGRETTNECESTAECCADMVSEAPTIDPKSLRPVAHWEEIHGSCVSSAGKSGSWCVPATRCTNPKCGEVNPCGLKTPFCPMCGFRMEDVPYDDD